ncbi:MAG: hypothetical protein HeimC3_09380 [Candidatus Heimdallarchaeota archaeon LC_3]|nr:MAG: hypothetical protein HeimC3_09380 [Candidatus Heimdallarchaeota archaeon LC_3]
MRRKIILEIYISNKEKIPIFVSRIKNILEEKSLDNKPSRSTIRKHVKVLLEFKYIRIINNKGKPKYLALTDSGKRIISLMKNEVINGIQN